mmetsp:Transcript_60615/g.67797  ORF Transcript_60615/g.67797 Transcript_60615/m.67797 type:complete len:211 (-) Transcript_60615:829-1461(-)
MSSSLLSSSKVLLSQVIIFSSFSLRLLLFSLSKLASTSTVRPLQLYVNVLLSRRCGGALLLFSFLSLYLYGCFRVHVTGERCCFINGDTIFFLSSTSPSTASSVRFLPLVLVLVLVLVVYVDDDDAKLTGLVSIDDDDAVMRRGHFCCSLHPPFPNRSRKLLLVLLLLASFSSPPTRSCCKCKLFFFFLLLLLLPLLFPSSSFSSSSSSS